MTAVTLRPITDANRDIVSALALTEIQDGCVAAVAESLIYLRCGFIDTGEIFDGERVLRLPLTVP